MSVKEQPEAATTPDGPIGPLTGVRVVDLSSYLAGPYGCTLLADLGAEVIKVEPPEGDTLRQFPSSLDGESRLFLGINRGKLGIVLDLKQPEGLAALERLVESADVLVHNFRPSVPPRLKIDHDRLRGINPRLIYCALTGFGDSGPLKDNAGFDQVLQCMTGMATFQGAAAGRPQTVLGSAVDYYSSALLALAVASALFHRQRTGEGQYIGASLLRSALTMQSGRFIWAEGEGRDVARDLRAGGLTGIHPTKEGDIYVSMHSNPFWRALCERVGLEELANDPRYDSMQKRADHAPELLPRLRAALATRSALEWEQIFGHLVPCGAVRPIEDMFDHPQAAAEGLVATMEHPTVGRYRGLSKPLRFEATPGPAPRAAPALGQHTAEVLRRAGYAEDEIDHLRRLGAIR
jgi:crotonobetainyl-CoA:carnitine CoA-transferase CaiB-like acyl-CoA transferase